jgi:para-nitrobenzyl esterase
VDGSTLPRTVQAAFTTGLFNRVPIIEGTTHDEFRLFQGLSILQNGPLPAVAYTAAIAATLGVPAPVASIVAAQYPLANYPTPDIALATVGTDAAFSCNAALASGLLSQYVPIWAYEFNDPNAPQIFLPPLPNFPYAAYHGSEVPYLFDTRAAVPAPSFTPAQKQLSGTMTDYWARFARLGNPNLPLQAPLWNRYQPPTSDRYQLLAPPQPTAYTGTGIDIRTDRWPVPKAEA